jgi:hypothetical protein
MCGNDMLKPKAFADTQIMLQKNAPEIMVAVGVVGVLASTVLACRATLKAPEKLAEAKKKFADIAELREMSLDPAKSEMLAIDYPEQEYRQDLIAASTQTAVDFLKLYGVPAALMIGSIFCIFKGHGITVQRNAGLTSAVTALTAGYKAYRQRVRDEFGEEAEQRVYYGVKDEIVESTDAKGKITKKKKAVASLELPSTYAKFFDEASHNWQPSPEMNLAFLRAQQNYMNDRLHINKHLFLNEVYDTLGLPRTSAGAVVGWAITSDGDNFVDFGLFDNDTFQKRRFINGEEMSVLLDFNVNGVVYDMI